MRRRPSPRHGTQAGFTLPEVLVALMLLGVVLAIGHQGVRFLIATEATTATAVERLARLQVALTLFERDLVQTIDRPIRDGSGRTLAALQVAPGGPAAVLEFTRAGSLIPDGWHGDPRNSDLLRVGYRWEARRLVRDVWPVLDRVPGSRPKSDALLEGVRALRVRVRSDDGSWHLRTPLPEVVGRPPLVPVAIELAMTVDDIGDVRRLIVLRR